ncbi:MAG: Bcr/CflA family multidrug efflux MFS transporter [Thermomicrobiales bacterium]
MSTAALETDAERFEAPPDPRPSRVGLIVLLGALSAFAPLSIDMYLPALPELRRDLSGNASQAQLTLSACLIGLAFGQLLAGPMSDIYGRRKPLLIGVAAYAVGSLLCAVASSISLLVTFRFVQGFAGAAGIVIARAIVRDLHSGAALARFFSVLMLVSGSAPILAPIVGAQLLRFTTWRGVFVVLALIGLVLFIAAALRLAETAPARDRETGALRSTLRTFRQLAGDRSFMRYALSGGFAIAAMFAYIAGSPFVLQEIYGVSEQRFSLMFGTNALGIVLVSQINARLVARIPPERLLRIGLSAIAIGGALLLAVVWSGSLGLAGILPALFIVVASLGFVLPNTAALALAGHARVAGTASAVLGLMQYAVGAFAAPLVGLGGEGTALPMAVVIATAGSAAVVAFWLLGRTATTAR